MVYAYAVFSGFYCSMETLRRIGAGTRKYNSRIAAAVSREHVLVICITRKVTHLKKDKVLVLASKLTLLCGLSK